MSIKAPARGGNRAACSSAYIFGTICPLEGKGAAIVVPRCVTEAMSEHLAGIAYHVAPDAHAIGQREWACRF